MLKNIFKRKINSKSIAGLQSTEMARLNDMPRFKQTSTEFFGSYFIIPDSCTFLSSYNEIFLEEIYKFNCSIKKPVIIDCGANIGMATVYFKLNYPESQVFAYEPDPKLFEALKRNIKSLNFNTVELFNEAIGEKKESLFFNLEGGHSGMLVSKPSKDTITVSVTPLREVLGKLPSVDFLKIDIEGHEINVLPSIAEELKKVKVMFLEYHTFIDEPQQLSVIIKIIEDAGFRYYIKEAAYKKNPFVERELFYKMDMLVNIFCYRD